MERKSMSIWKKKINKLTFAEFMFACFVLDVVWYAVRGIRGLISILVDKHKKKREKKLEEKAECDLRKDTE